MIKNTVALITGGAGSLGLATAKMLVREGCKVMIMDLPQKNKEKTLKEIDGGENAKFFHGNVKSDKDMELAFEELKKKFGRLDVLVNCAGVAKSRVLFNYKKNRICSLDEFQEILDVNIMGTFNSIRYAGPLFYENVPDKNGLRGLIINTSGFYAFDGQMGQSALAAAAGAIASMTLPLCRDFASFGVRIMAIAPGVMKSNLTSGLPEKVSQHIEVFTPSPKRLGDPNEYAQLVKTIIENKFLNGEVIRLDGGLRTYLV